ncbi:septation protein SepH [Kocuria varians]|uniref:septation protein SepH n=1 Tax=Kocuria varians TaxID=1272 RepID=UPI00083875F8|nr:septation protein SepH [Kocuria varians]
MEQLRLVGVHDDGEHLIVETPDSTRYRVKIDQQLRQTIQHARRKPPARGRGGSSFGPRDIQARFRAGASVEDIVAESGWEAERVRRYEWPILAERSHMVTAACRVKVSGTNPSHDGYRSVFEGEPKTLEETVTDRAAQLGVDRHSFDWDAWLREDQLWNLQLSFTVTDPAAGPQGEGPARWSYNPVSQTVRPENDWARALGEEPRESGPLGVTAPAAPVTSTPAAVSPAAQLRHLQHEASQADDLLDVLQSRRGRRLGTDEDADDRLAEILGRGMGGVEQRPRPIDAPDDSPVFDRPIQPAASRVAEEQALQGEGIEILDDSSTYGEDTPPSGRDETEHRGPEHHAPDSHSASGAESEGDDAAAAAPESSAPDHLAADAPDRDTEARETTSAPAPESEAVVHRLPGANQHGAGNETPAPPAEAGGSRSDGAVTAEGDDETEETSRAGNEETPSEEQRAPGPRGRTPRAKRSSVPSWDDIVFGNRP